MFTLVQRCVAVNYFSNNNFSRKFLYIVVVYCLSAVHGHDLNGLVFVSGCPVLSRWRASSYFPSITSVL